MTKPGERGRSGRGKGGALAPGSDPLERQRRGGPTLCGGRSAVLESLSIFFPLLRCYCCATFRLSEMQREAENGDQHADAGEDDRPNRRACSRTVLSIAASNLALVCSHLASLRSMTAARSLFMRASTSSALAAAAASMARVSAAAWISEKPGSFCFSAMVRMFFTSHDSLKK
jgi:hypothetical protein